MRVVSLASGSKGNAYVVEHAGVALLIDCGLTGKDFETRFKAAFPDAPCELAAVLVTHSHTDHTKGLSPLLHRYENLVVYANFMTSETVARDQKLDESAFCCFENGQSFEVGPFEVAAFSIPHDTSDPVGYLVRCPAAGLTYFHGTDIGTPLDSVGVKLAEADIAILESNHDPVMLRTSGRPSSLIQRIAGPRGHLANHEACELVRRFASPRLKHLALAHLSQDCNAPHLADSAMRETLNALGRGDVALKILEQDCVIEVFG